MASRGLGTLTLSLIAKIGGFEQGMDKAARHADKRMRDIERRSYAFGKALGASLKVAAGIAATGFGLYLKNTIEAEKVQAQLLARIKDTGAAAGRTLQQLNAQADRLQNLTVFDDEAIGNAQAMLLTFKQIQGVNFDEAVEAATDLATVMGTDLTESAKLVGKALNDPIKGMSALSRAGVTFTDDQRKVIESLVKTGDVAGAQRVILDKLAGTMGTAAEAARNTLGGALQGLKNTFDNLLEGDASGGGIVATKDAVNALNDSLNDPNVKAGIDAIAGGIANIVAQSIEGIGALQRFGQNLHDVFDISNKVASGAPASAFSDRELQVRLANLSEQKSKARKSGDLAKVDALQKQITALIRENTERLKQTIVAGVTPRGYDKETRGTGIFANVNTTPKVAGGTSGGSGRAGRATSGGGRDPAADFVRSMEEQARAAADLQRQLDALDEARFQAIEGWGDLTAQLAGPLAEAEREHIRRLQDIQALGEQAGATAEQIKAAKAQETAAYQAVTAAIREQQEAMANPELVRGLDGLRSIATEFLVDLPERGLSSWKTFFDDLAGMFRRMIAEHWMDALFGKPGTTGSGTSGGGWFASLFGMIFGSGGFGGAGSPLANGGPINPSLFHEVGENDRPEMLMRGGKRYLIPGNKGRVVPFAGGRGVTQVINNNYAAPTDPRTQDQVATKVGFQTRRALARNT